MTWNQVSNLPLVERAALWSTLRRLRWIVVLISVVLAGLSVYFLAIRPNPRGRVIDSIAVLPLVNVNADVNGEYSGILSSTREASQNAKEAAGKALEIDDSLPAAHASLGIVKMYLDWDWPGAEREFRRAIELNPGDAAVHESFGWFLGLMARFDESIAELQEAQRIDPLSVVTISALGSISYWEGQLDQAIGYYKNALDLDPNFTYSRLCLAEAYATKGQVPEALAESQKTLSRIGRNPFNLWALGRVYAMSGKSAETRNTIDEVQRLSRNRKVPAYFAAALYAELDEIDRAFEWLEKSYDERSTMMAFLKVDPALRKLRSDARFIDLRRRVGFD